MATLGIRLSPTLPQPEMSSRSRFGPMPRFSLALDRATLQLDYVDSLLLSFDQILLPLLFAMRLL